MSHLSPSLVSLLRASAGELRAAKPHRRGHWERELAKMRMPEDRVEILGVLFDHVFPLELYVGTEIGQLRTFTIPSISKLLHKTREYEDHGPKRLDDTKGILSHLLDHDPGTPEGDALVSHLNWIHGHYRISNDDFLYVLSVFIVDPIQWIAKYGFRPLSRIERLALFEHFRIVGRAMKIESIPDTLEEFISWRERYESKHQRFHQANAEVARGLLRAVESMLPQRVRSLVTPTVLSLIPEQRFRDTLGLGDAPRLFDLQVQQAMRARRRYLRGYNPWRERRFRDSPLYLHMPTYPDGYDPLAMGPAKLMRGCPRAQSACPRS